MIEVLKLAEELGNVSKACGLCWDTFYRYKSAVEEGDLDALIERLRRKPNLKNRVDEKTERAVMEHAPAFPAHDLQAISLESKAYLFQRVVCAAFGFVIS